MAKQMFFNKSKLKSRYFTSRIHVFGVFVAGAALLSACSYTANSDIQNPVVRKASWFSYLNGDDLRSACSAGEAEGRIRLTYNADYYKEVRSYNILPYAGNETFKLESYVFGPADVSQINVTLNAPLGFLGGKKVEQNISRSQYLSLTDAMVKDGFGTQNRDGLRLFARDFYWVALGCSKKHITLAAWSSAKDDLRGLGFPGVIHGLSGIDSDLPLPPAADAPKLPDPNYSANDRKEQTRNFYQTVRGNTLR